MSSNELFGATIVKHFLLAKDSKTLRTKTRGNQLLTKLITSYLPKQFSKETKCSTIVLESNSNTFKKFEFSAVSGTRLEAFEIPSPLTSRLRNPTLEKKRKKLWRARDRTRVYVAR